MISILVLFHGIIFFLTQNKTEKSENKTATFPIPQGVYIGVVVATIGTTATVASVVTLS